MGRLVSITMTIFRRNNFSEKSIFHKTVLTVTQTEQLAATEKKEHLVIPNHLLQNTAHADLVLRREFLAGERRVLVSLLHLMLLKGHLHDLVAQVDKSDTRSVVAAVHHHIDSFSEFLVVVKELYWICVVVHNAVFVVNGYKHKKIS